MATLSFTPNLKRLVECPPATIDAATVHELLVKYFAQRPLVRGYVLEDDGHVRKHMTIFVDGLMVRDRAKLTDSLAPDSDVWVFQALSGG